MEGTNLGGRGLLEQAQAELAELEGRVTALRALLDRAVQLESSAGEEVRREAEASGVDSTRAPQARSMASHMALSGYPRWSAEDRLRGTVAPGALREILDEIYGPRGQAS